jgi:hypothetical protein
VHNGSDHRFLPSHIAQWAEDNRYVLDLIAERFAAYGTWPRVAELQRQLAISMDPPPALSALLYEMPKPLGFIDREKVVLTLFGLYESEAGRKLVDAFAACVRLAVERYRASDMEPTLRREDLTTELGLDEHTTAALSEVILREAPFRGDGSGFERDEWQRAITEDIVRYWDVRTADDFLTIRAGELKDLPQLGWGTFDAAAHEEPPRASEPEGDATPVPEVEHKGIPPGVSIAVGFLALAAGVVPFFTGSPVWLSVGVVAAAVGVGVVWRGGFRWPPTPAAIVAVLAVAGLSAAAAYAVTQAIDGDEAQQQSPPPHLVGVDLTASTDGMRDQYLPGLMAIADLAAEDGARLFTAGLGGDPVQSARWSQVDFSKQGDQGSESLREIRAAGLTDDYRSYLANLLRFNARTSGTSLGEILAVMAQKCRSEGPPCRMWLFTDGAWRDELINVRKGVTLQQLQRYVTHYVPTFAGGLDGAEVLFIGVGLGSDLTAVQLNDARQVAVAVVRAAGGEPGWRTDLPPG